MPQHDTAKTVTTRAAVKNLAPDVFHQRLMLEGHFGGAMDKARFRRLLLALAAALDLRTYGDPVVFVPASGMGKDANAGFDAWRMIPKSGDRFFGQDHAPTKR